MADLSVTVAGVVFKNPVIPGLLVLEGNTKRFIR